MIAAPVIGSALKILAGRDGRTGDRFGAAWLLQAPPVRRTAPIKQTAASGSGRLGWASLAGMILAALCFWQALPEPAGGPEAMASVAAAPSISSPERKLETVSIRELRVGTRVLAENPELLGTEIPPLEIDPERWRTVRLSLPKPAGGKVLITLLRPLEWLDHMGAAVGKTVHLDLEELGAAGQATVLEIAPCPPIEQDNGTGRRLVTGTFEHLAGNVLDLRVASQAEPIGVTANIPSGARTGGRLFRRGSCA